MKIIFAVGVVTLGILADVQLSLACPCSIATYDEDAIRNAEENCETIIIDGINVPAGVGLNLNLKEGTKLIFNDTITWEFYQWDGPLVNITGVNVDISGAPGHLLDVRGELWWDGKGEAGDIVKPLAFIVHGLNNSILHDLKFRNPSYHTVWIENSDGVIAQDVIVDSLDGDTLGGKNTDGFNVWTSNNVTIQRITIVNQDDCVAIKSGTNIIVRDAYCSGGHGLSIGSVGGRDYNIVENVTISNIEVVDSENGIRIKTRYNTTGSVTNVTYEDIVMRDSYLVGIKVHGNYGNNTYPATPGFPISGLFLRNVTGTVIPNATNILVQVQDASNWHWTDVNVTGGEVIRECYGIPEDSGISCY